MKLVYFTLCLFLVWTQATPIDKLRQHAARAAAASQGAATTSFVEKETIEMEKTDNKRSDITEADEVADLMKTEAENAAAASSSQNTNENRDVQDGTFSNAGFSSAEEEAHNAAMLSHQASAADNTDVVAAPADSASSSSLSATTPSSPSTSSSDATTTPTSSPAAALAEKASSKTDAKKPMEWQDAVLVDDLTIERATADANTRFIGANMKTTKVGKAKEATQGPSFLQFGPPAYYIHPAFLQQHEAEAATRAQAGAQTQGWGDYGTPLYYARDFGSFDGLGAGGVNMYGAAAYPGYYPYTSGLDPTTQGVPPYYSPYGAYGTFSPPAPPPPPFDLPLPPYIKQVPAA